MAGECKVVKIMIPLFPTNSGIALDYSIFSFFGQILMR